MRLSSAYVLAALYLAVLPASAKIEYRVKNPDAPLFNNPGLTPPPLGFLEEGAVLGLIRKGPDACKVRRADGTIGWMANKDLVAMSETGSAKHQIGEMEITGEGPVYSPLVLLSPNPVVEVSALDRSFIGDVVEFADREQVEIRHEEN